MDRIAAKQSVSLPMNFVAATFSRPGRRPPPIKLSMNRSISISLLDRDSTLADYRQDEAVSRDAEPRRAEVRKESASRRFCTAQASPVRGNAISHQWLAWKRRADGLRVLVSSTEFGQGTNTILCQIAAETLGLQYDDVEMAQPDTSISPNSGPTVASRTVDDHRQDCADRGLKIRQTLIAAGLLEPTTARVSFSPLCQTYLASNWVS